MKTQTELGVECMTERRRDELVALGATVTSDTRGYCPSGATGAIKMEVPAELVLKSEFTAADSEDGQDVTEFVLKAQPDVKYLCFHGNAYDTPSMKRRGVAPSVIESATPRVGRGHW